MQLSKRTLDSRLKAFLRASSENKITIQGGSGGCAFYLNLNCRISTVQGLTYIGCCEQGDHITKLISHSLGFWEKQYRKWKPKRRLRARK